MMKKSIRMCIIAILSITMVIPAVAQQRDEHHDPTQLIKKIMVIKGNESWKNTEIQLNAADEVTITATGNVMFSSGNLQSSVSPNGLNQMQYKLKWSGDAELCEDPIKNANHSALIAKVGRSSFFVGESLTFSSKVGIMYLGINDCSLIGQYKNTGKFNVHIKVVRGK